MLIACLLTSKLTQLVSSILKSSNIAARTLTETLNLHYSSFANLSANLNIELY